MWGGYVKVYVMKKDPKNPENRVSDDPSLAHFSAKDDWSTKEVTDRLKMLKKFIKDFEKAIEKYGVENIVVRSNK